MGEIFDIKELKEKGSIVELLHRLGFEPARKFGKEYMYQSMLRDGDNDPSFSVDDKIGAWYDHGTGRGGNIIDLGVAFWPALTFKEVVEKIRTACDIDISEFKRERPPRISVKVRNYQIQTTKDLGTHPAITNYLKERGVFEVSRGKLSEIYYQVVDDKGRHKPFFAAGWKNEAGSWEVRNKYFKGCLGSKDITIIPGDQKQASVFEGYINYLSWLTENRDARDSIIVLNTLSLLPRCIERSKQFSALNIYFDRDRAGFQAAKDFIKALPYATDRSLVFEGYNDYNDKIVADKDQFTGERVARMRIP